MITGDRFQRILWAGALGGAVALATACQGSYSTGPQLPPTGQYGQGTPQYPQSAPSRQQITDTSVPVKPSVATLDVADFAGFALRIDLVKPSPQPTSAAAAGATSAPAKTKLAPKPSPSPTAASEDDNSDDSDPTDSPKPAATATPTGPRIDTKLTIYPDGTQKPPGDSSKPEGRRVGIVVAAMHPSVNVSMYSFDAFRFTIPDSERTDKRGYTIALYETRKRHKDREIVSRVGVTPNADGEIGSHGVKGPLTLEKDHTYSLILFADPPPQTPPPYQPPQYQQPGQPGSIQQPGFGQPGFGQPGYPSQPGYPGQPGYPTPTPSPTPFGFVPTPHF